MTLPNECDVSAQRLKLSSWCTLAGACMTCFSAHGLCISCPLPTQANTEGRSWRNVVHQVRMASQQDEDTNTHMAAYTSNVLLRQGGDIDEARLCIHSVAVGIGGGQSHAAF